MSRTKKITLGISTTALALGLGFGAAGMASAATTPSPAPSVSASVDGNAGTPDEGKRGGQGVRGQLAADLATKLGVDEAKVAAALQAFRDANRPAGGDGTKPDRSAKDAALATALAGALEIEESKVTAALEELRTADQSRRAAAMKARLDSAVTQGTLTQAEADAVTKAVERGVIGAGR